MWKRAKTQSRRFSRGSTRKFLTEPKQRPMPTVVCIRTPWVTTIHTSTSTARRSLQSLAWRMSTGAQPRKTWSLASPTRSRQSYHTTMREAHSKVEELGWSRTWLVAHRCRARSKSVRRVTTYQVIWTGTGVEVTHQRWKSKCKTRASIPNICTVVWSVVTARRGRCLPRDSQLARSWSVKSRKRIGLVLLQLRLRFTTCSRSMLQGRSHSM